MALLQEKGVQIVDTIRPQVSKGLGIPLRRTRRGALQSPTDDAKYIAKCILAEDRDDVIARISHTISEGFDPEVDCVGVGEQILAT